MKAFTDRLPLSILLCAVKLQDRCCHLVLEIEATKCEQLIGVGVEAGERVGGDGQVRQHAPAISTYTVLFTFCSSFFVDSLATKDEYDLLLDTMSITTNTAPI